MQVEIQNGEEIDDLEYKGLKIIQKQNSFKFGVDAVLLSHFAKKVKKGSYIMDLGTGNGIIPILLAAKTQARKIVGVEIQPIIAEMANRSIKMNELEDKIEIWNEDLKNIPTHVEPDSIDIIVTNPPYQKANTGLTNDKEEEKIARHEICCTLEDICLVSNKVLKDNGAMYMIHRPERLVDIFWNMRKNNLEPKIIQYVQPTKEAKANMILIKAVKNARPFLTIEKPLIIYTENGSYTQELLKIYEKGE